MSMSTSRLFKDSVSQSAHGPLSRAGRQTVLLLRLSLGPLRKEERRGDATDEKFVLLVDGFLANSRSHIFYGRLSRFARLLE